MKHRPLMLLSLVLSLHAFACGSSTSSLTPRPFTEPLAVHPTPLDDERVRDLPAPLQRALQLDAQPYWARAPYSPLPDPDPIASCVTHRHVASCMAVAISATHGQGSVSANPGAAARAFFSLCHHGVAPACLFFARTAAQGIDGVPGDIDIALWDSVRSCELGEPEGCAEVGSMAEHSPDLPRRLAVTEHLHQAACAGGSLIGCNHLARIRIARALPPEDQADAVPDETLREITRDAAALFLDTCWRGFEPACWAPAYLEASGALSTSEPMPLPALASTLRGMINTNDETLRDISSVLEAHCEATQHAGACISTAASMRIGQNGVTRDEARAQSIFKRVCESDDVQAPRACSMIAIAYASGIAPLKEDLPRAQAILDEACADGFRNACHDAGLIRVQTGVEAGDDAMVSAGLAPLREQCAQGLSSVCLELINFCVTEGTTSACTMFDSIADAPITPPMLHVEQDLESLAGCVAYPHQPAEMRIHCDGQQTPNIVLQLIPPQFSQQPLPAILQAIGYPKGSEVTTPLDIALPNLTVTIPYKPGPSANARLSSIIRQPTGYSTATCVAREAFDEPTCRARLRRIALGIPNPIQANLTPRRVRLVDTNVTLQPGCNLQGPTEVACENAGRILWWRDETLDAARERLAFQLEQIREPAVEGAAVEVTLDTQVPCEVGGQALECGKTRLKVVAPGQFQNTLEVFHVIGTFDGEPGFAICDFYSDQAGPGGGLPAICAQVFDLQGAPP